MNDVLVGIGIVALVFLAVVVSGLLAVYSRFWIDHPVSESYAALMTADSLWAGCYLLMLLGSGGPLTEVGLVGKGLMSTLAGVAWFRFVSEYTGDSEWIPGWFWRVAIAEAVAFGLLVVINPSNLVISDVTVGQIGMVTFAVESGGPLTAVQLLISAGLVTVSLVFLGQFFVRTQSVYRYQAAIIFATGVIVVVSSVLFVGEYRIHLLVDPTPILFNLQAVGVGWALYRYDFLKLAPVIVTRFFRDMSDPVLIIDAEYVVADYNTAAAELVDGLDTEVTITEIDNERFSRTLRTAVTDADDDVEFAKPMTDGGQQRTYDVEETEVTDQFEITQGYVVVLRDITDRKRRERRLREQNQRLDEFADIVSHDLRNPLSTAAGWTELIDRKLADDEPDTEAIRDHLEEVVDAHERMDELIEVLLTMARQGRTVDEPELVAVEQCATEAWQTTATEGMELVVDAEGTIEADPARFKQALENLFRNANDHGEASTVYVTDTADGLAVEDDGAGIPEEDKASLFEFGYSTDAEGTGIGLAVVERIVEAHGWRISIDDSDHGGARVELTVA